MNRLSTGDDSTLGVWKKLVTATFGSGPALDFINKKIQESPHGEQEEVLADERQFLYALANMQR